VLKATVMGELAIELKISRVNSYNKYNRAVVSQMSHESNQSTAFHFRYLSKRVYGYGSIVVFFVKKSYVLYISLNR